MARQTGKVALIHWKAGGSDYFWDLLKFDSPIMAFCKGDALSSNGRMPHGFQLKKPNGTVGTSLSTERKFAKDFFFCALLLFVDDGVDCW